MNRKTFIRTIGLGAAGGVVASAAGAEASPAGALGGTTVGEDDTLIVQIGHDVDIDDEDRVNGLKEALKRATGCGEVLLVQGIDAMHVVSRV